MADHGAPVFDLVDLVGLPVRAEVAGSVAALGDLDGQGRRPPGQAVANVLSRGPETVGHRDGTRQTHDYLLAALSERSLLSSIILPRLLLQRPGPRWADDACSARAHAA